MQNMNDHSHHEGMNEMKNRAANMDHSMHNSENTENDKKNIDHSRMDHSDHEAMMSDPTMAREMELDMKRRFFISLILAVPIFLLSPVGTNLLGIRLPDNFNINLILFVLTTPVVFWTGSIFVTGAYKALKSRKLDMMVLVATGVLAAYIFSVLLTFTVGGESFYEASALLVTFVLFGHWMEIRSRKGTYDALRALFDLVPPKAIVIREGKELEIMSSEILKDDIVLVKPGSKIPVDGIVIEGESSIDESLITGESIPITKLKDDMVIGGSVNLTGVLRFKATNIGNETVLGQIIKMVQKAQYSKAPGQRIADKAAGLLVLVAIGAGLTTFIIWYLIFKADLLTALTFAISVVVIACPDALGLATPTAVAVGTGIGARHNILIKDAATLENTSRINSIVMDKTGTLTEGKPRVTEIKSYNNFSKEEVLQIQASIETNSNHPIAKAITDEASAKSIDLLKVDKFESIAGHGLSGEVGSKKVLVGNIAFLKNSNIDLVGTENEINSMFEKGFTLSLLSINGKFAGIIAVADTIKQNAGTTVRALKQLGIEVTMISGDNTKVAESVAKQIDIDRVFAEVLPQDKALYVKKLQDEGKFVAMVGDGVNDAPALAQSDVGIAIGAGTDVAIETGNIVLMKSDPHDILSAIILSKATVTKMKQNLFWAAIYNLLAIPVAAGLFYPSFGIILRPEASAILMSLSSIIVATNAVLLRRVDKKL